MKQNSDSSAEQLARLVSAMTGKREVSHDAPQSPYKICERLEAPALNRVSGNRQRRPFWWEVRAVARLTENGFEIERLPTT